MQHSNLLKLGACALCVGLFGCDRDVSFAEDVQPILVASCMECHNNSAEGVAASGFSVENYRTVMKGTKFGAAVVPGNSMSSTLYRVVAHETDPAIQMPPHHEEALAKGRGFRLSEKQIATIGAWIDQGAKDN